MNDKKQATIATYVGDMHAVEKHMLEAFEGQLDLTKDSPEAHQVVQQLVDTSRRHVAALESHLKTFDSAATEKLTDAIKAGVSGALGVAAGLIDKVRPQAVSKALRDSYTATNHAVIAYIMLHTTAEGLGDQQTASLAERQLQETVKNAQAIANVMPKLVAHDLKTNEGLNVSEASLNKIKTSQTFSNLFGSTSSMGATARV